MSVKAGVVSENAHISISGVSNSMRRRTVIAGALATVVTPRSWGQSLAKQYRIAIVTSALPAHLISKSGGDSASRLLFAKLRKSGYLEGKNLIVQRHSAEGRSDLLPDLASVVVASRPDLIIARGGQYTQVLAAATASIPIVATFADPVKYGLVASLAQSGSNITGVSVDAGIEIVGKRLQFLKETVPTISKVAYFEVSGLATDVVTPILAAASRELRISVVVVPLPDQAQEHTSKRSPMIQQKIGAVLVSDGGKSLAFRQLIVHLAEKNRLPTMCPSLDYVEVGGLLAYAADPEAVFEHIADNVHQILNGTSPSVIPIIQPTRFLLLINLRTAEALKINISPIFGRSRWHDRVDNLISADYNNVGVCIVFR